MSEGVLQLFFHLHPVLSQISVHHFDSFMDRFRAVVRERCDSIFGHQVGPGARGEAFVRLDEFGDVYSSEDWVAYGAREWNLVLLPRNAEGQGMDELPLIMTMIG